MKFFIITGLFLWRYLNNKKSIKPGRVYKIGPGIYIENGGGIRIEDMVIMTESGNNLISHALKETY